ncbi:type I restriction endonuclease subunit R [Helicobacter sp. 23-1045]
MKNEAKTRINIDELLQSCGFVLQDKAEFNRFAKAQGQDISAVAVREFTMSDGSYADYLLFIEGKACGVIEAKREGKPTSGAHAQSKHYATHLPTNLKAWANPLPFLYESNGGEIFFTDLRESHTQAKRARRVFAFHTPKSLLDKLQSKSTLRQNLATLPQIPLDSTHLRPCQAEAITALENSLALNKPRALIQMATGAGKTFTACNFISRLFIHANAGRILFLVDRNNLGEQAKKEFDNFRIQNRKFSEIYITNHLQTNHIDKDSKLVITTIQRLYSLLKGEAEFDSSNEEHSAFDSHTAQHTPPKELKYNPAFPIDFFDFIIVDECHRSIYGEWRQVLEYFDAFIIGLSATPSKHTLGFFAQNMVSQYPLEKSIIDGVNVGFEIFRIATKISEKGGVIQASDGHFAVPKRDKRTRKLIYESIDEDLEYKKADLDKSVVSFNQIHTILECYKNSVFTQLFPERANTSANNEAWIPKTLIFAKDDAHAEEIVRIAREVFNADNDFCQKITYNIGKQSPKELIAEFRTSPKFRIAVTVDMIATGTDIKPLEVLIFMRDVKSKLYYEQMLGRGVRTVHKDSLKEVTPNANGKNHFFVIDAVGVTESLKTISSPLERKKGVSFKKLLESVAMGANDEDTISSLANRLAKLALNATPQDNELARNLSAINDKKGKDLRELARDLSECIDSDFCADKSEAQIESIKDTALMPFNNPLLRQHLLEMASKNFIYIDDISVDEVITGEFSTDNALKQIQNFKDFIEAHKDELEALQIIYTQSYAKRHLTRNLINELHEKLRFAGLGIASLWNAYALTQKGRVKPLKNQDSSQNSNVAKLTNLIQLVRFELGFDSELRNFCCVANSRFELWKGRQIKKGIDFSAEQLEFLIHIKDYIIANAYLANDDLQGLNDACGDTNGVFVAKALFGDRFAPLLDELNFALLSGLSDLKAG